MPLGELMEILVDPESSRNKFQQRVSSYKPSLADVVSENLRAARGSREKQFCQS